jgi:hypothetical protein
MISVLLENGVGQTTDQGSQCEHTKRRHVCKPRDRHQN